MTSTKKIFTKCTLLLTLECLVLLYQNCSRFEAESKSIFMPSEPLGIDLVTFEKVNEVLLRPHCLSCHNPSSPSGGVDLSSYDSLMKSNVITPYSSNSSTLFISMKVGSMPPNGTLDAKKLNLLAEWIDGGAIESLDRTSCEDKAPLLPRLTHYEYEMIIRDITKIESALTELQNLPTLPPRYGFDNISNTKIDRVTAEAYLNTSETIADRIISSASILNLCETNILPGQHNWDNCAHSIVKFVGDRLFRRPLRVDEITKYKVIFDNIMSSAAEAYAAESPPTGARSFNRSFREGLSAILMSQLLSPNFLFKLEYFPEVHSVEEKYYSIAAKLSLSIGSTYPDEELWLLARDGKLNNESVLEYQIQRLLRKYNERFARNFAGQWLGFKNNLQKQVTDIDGALARESSLVFQEIINENQRVSHLLSPGYTFVNQLLSNHFEMPIDTTPTKFVKISSHERGGILSQGHFLKSTSSVSKTSPIKRGIWVLDTVLCNSGGVLHELTQGTQRVNQNVMILRKIRAGFPTLDPHWQNPAAFLSGNQIRLSLDRPRCGRSIDQLIADTRETPFRSIEIGGPYFHIHPLADHPNYPDIYMNRIAWAQDELPLTPIVDPYQLFSYLFSGSNGNLKQIQYQHLKKKSILDLVSSELRTVAGRTSSEGRLIMEEYESGLREIEKGLGQDYNCEKPSAPNLVYTDRERNYIDRIQQFQKMLVFALKCQLTNVATMMYAPAVSGELYYHGDLGNNAYDHHAAAHNGGSAAKINRQLQVNRMHIGLLKHLLNLLKEQGLINETLVLFGTDMSNGDTHNTNDIPTLLCGGGSDLKFGQEITFSTQQPHTSLLLSILSLSGIQRSELGEGLMRSTSNLNNFLKV